MANKRKIDEVDKVDNVQSTVNQAELLRAKLLAYKPSPGRRIRKPRTLAPEALNYASATAPFFKDLPREIRDQIYSLLWQDTPTIVQQYKRKVYTVSYGDLKKDHPATQVPWLLTNKQMLHEGLEEFHERSVWNLKGELAGPSDYTFPLITPGLVRTLHLCFGNRRGELASDKPFHQHDSIVWGEGPLEDAGETIQRYFWLQQSTQTDLNIMTRSMEVRDGIKNIKVTVNVPSDFCHPVIHQAHEQPIVRYWFDLSYFERLAVHRGLRMFEVTINSYVGYFTEELEEFVRPLMDEFERVGVLLTEGDVETSLESAKDHHGITATVRCFNPSR